MLKIKIKKNNKKNNKNNINLNPFYIIFFFKNCSFIIYFLKL